MGVGYLVTESKPPPPRVALAGNLEWLVPIPGTTKVRPFEENLGSMDVHLKAEDMRQIEQGSAPVDDRARHSVRKRSRGWCNRSPMPYTFPQAIIFKTEISE